MAKYSGFTVIRDTREKDGEGWVFDAEEKKSGRFQCLGTETACLDAGDYSIKGYEHVVRIERKFGIAELFGNMSPVSNKERFEREMQKMLHVPHRYIVIEGNLSKDVLGMSIPQFYKAPPSSVVLRWLLELEIEYGIVPIFAGDAGKKTARSIFEVVLKRLA